MSNGELTNQELQDRLHRAEESLRKSEKLTVAGRYAGAVMHEVRNPLEAIANLLYLTRIQAHDANQVCRNLRVAEAQLERLGEITRKTLSFYREEPVAKDFDIVEIAESALHMHSHRFAAKPVAILKQFPERAMVRVFEGEILQVLSNLILNALDALPDKDPALWLRVKVLGGHAHITIADNGYGIHPSMHKCLFEPYITNKKEGNGIGLWLSKCIIDKHCGTIRFRSSQRNGQSGTVFRLSLPLEGSRQIVA